MSKGANKVATTDLSRFYKSTFTLTFAVEILGIDVWHDCNEGTLDLGPNTQGMKIQYQLYPGQTFDIDVLIWPHTAKVWCGTQYGWVRTWQFLERRWLTFSIRHAFPVRVMDFQQHVATVTPTVGVGSLGANAKNDKNFEVFLPPLGFGDRRFFAPVLEAEESLLSFVKKLIWSTVVDYIPASCFDGLFDVPHAVSDVRHQDASLHHVQETILERTYSEEIEEPLEMEEVRLGRESKISKDKDKKKIPEAAKVKYEIRLTGDEIICGTGRIVPFKSIGDRPPDLGEIIVLISSNNLPAQDDYPIVFVNVDNLCDIPLYELKALRITQLYTKWQIGEEVHCSQPQPLRSKKDILFDDHHSIPLPYELVTKVMSSFCDDYYHIELRGIRLPPQFPTPVLFGYQKGDREFDASLPKMKNTDLDFLIAVTQIHAKKLSNSMNSIISGEYPLYPPMTAVSELSREGVCTNDINAIRQPVVPDVVVKSDVILLAQMTLEVTIGLVGCKTQQQSQCFSRMFSLIEDAEATTSILNYIKSINEDILETEKRGDLLTGFALDTGDVVIMFVEGPKDGHILHVWDMTEDFYPTVKPVFSCSARYISRIYPELVSAAAPFNILKMFVPLGVLLACPPVYTRPALPLPTRSAALKIGRLIASKFLFPPLRSEMPTSAELNSFRLELCVAPRPLPVFINDKQKDSVLTHLGVNKKFIKMLPKKEARTGFELTPLLTLVLNLFYNDHIEQHKKMSNPSVSRINWDT